MPDQADQCAIPDIPERLHGGARPVKAVPSDDRLYLRHESIGAAASYGLQIPGYRPENQSANSDLLNEGGNPLDVLFDTVRGAHFSDHQIACLNVADLCLLKLKNPNTIRYDSKRNPLNDPDEYTFEIVHKPTPCMYPHCEILALKNGAKQEVSKGFRTVIRSEIARLADKHRKAMLVIKP